MNIRKTHPLIKIINNSLIDLPTPLNISLWWNMGSLAGLCLMIQIITGILLVFFYCPNTELAFNSAMMICQDLNKGWIIRYAHANGASLFFICIYLHIGRGMYYQSYKYKETWTIGIILLLMTMGTAFLGYVLPWGQMSYWGASVITNLLAVIPFLGKEIVSWIWGEFSVSNITLTRFFTLHYLLPFIILSLVMLHLLFLHQTGSNNPLGLNSNKFKIPFHPYFSLKDIMGFIVLFMMMMSLISFSPDILGEPDNFILANPLVTPIHIQPEWYFLFAYAILRSIPNKMGGVIALLMSIMILFFMPMNSFNKFQGNQFYPINKLMFWIYTCILLILTWIGMRPVEIPYLLIGQIFSILYFSMYLIMPWINYKFDKMMN